MAYSDATEDVRVSSKAKRGAASSTVCPCCVYTACTAASTLAARAGQGHAPAHDHSWHEEVPKWRN
eukprot:1961567-Amphidinium_carterae.3